MLESQTTSYVLMIRPVNFAANLQTAATNAFQRLDVAQSHSTQIAQREFDLLARTLRASGVEVYEFADTPTPETPDALFPNNWVSFHADGRVVLYPMLATNRRAERREDVLTALGESFSLAQTVDLTHNEAANLFLEGTGSLVLDRVNRIAYAAISPRTHKSVLKEFGEQLGYKIVAFQASDGNEVPIYHTNVLMSLGKRFAVVCLESTQSEDRSQILSSIERTNHELIEISREQMANFAGNILELKTNRETSIVAMSDRARHALTAEQLAKLERLAGPIVSSPIPTIETLGGGSVRCMLAEIHLPPRAKY